MDIGQNNIKVLRCEAFESLLTITGQLHMVPGLLEAGAEKSTDIRLIIDHQDTKFLVLSIHSSIPPLDQRYSTTDAKRAISKITIVTTGRQRGEICRLQLLPTRGLPGDIYGSIDMTEQQRGEP
jgi:hypothetical protein